MKAIFCTALLLIAKTAIGQGQAVGALEEIIVTSPNRPSRVTRPSVVLDNEAIRERQPISVGDVFRGVTGITMRTNSRGESVVRIRGAEERQTLVFLDGAPLATPWDGRTDLALLPAGLIERVEVTRGVVPIEYGANAVAGAIDLLTLLPTDGLTLRAEVQQGSMGLQNVNAVAGLGLRNGWSFVLGGSNLSRDAERIAEKQSVAFDPSTTSARTNTDLSGNSTFAATAYASELFLLRAAILHADIARGVAAQGDLDPATTKPRFWRTPDWRLTQATVNGQWRIRPNVGLRVTGWQQWLEQTIDAYQGYSYATLQARERGSDRTVGVRLALSTTVDRATFRFVSSAQESTHDQIDSHFTIGAEPDLVEGPELRYRQRLLTLGLESDIRLNDKLISTFGLGVDRASTPLTGDKPLQKALSASGWSAGLRWTPTETWVVATTLGQRTRFPTPRELYGVALGRFLLNPSLRPERSVLADLSIDYDPSDVLSLGLALWANDSHDTLSQRTVRVDEVTRRQRFNTAGSFTVGIEASATIAIVEQLQAELSIAYQDGEVERDENGERSVLLQRPRQQLNAALDWQANSRVDLRVELSHLGPAYDLADSGEVARLPGSTSVNLRGFFNVGQLLGQQVLLTAAVDNLTDALVLPQLGLPAPGRAFHVGIRVN